MSSMSELYFDHFLVSPDFLMDIKLEPMDYELCKIACTEEDLKMCKEEFDNFEMQKVDVGLSSPLNVWLPCPGLTGAEDLDLEPADISEVEEEQMVFDWPRMESDWLVREVRGSDWLPPVREPDWQLQKFVDPPLPEHRNSSCLLAPHSHELLSQMKPCSVLLDSTTVPKYLLCRNPKMKPKRKQTSLKKTVQKRKKKPITITLPTQIKTMQPNTFLNLKYLEKNNPDFIYTDFSKSKRGQKYRRQLSNGIQSDGITDTSSRSSIDSESAVALYQCPYCLSLYHTEFEFRYHVSQKLSNNSRMYCIDAAPSMFECVDCLQVFESRNGFNRHMSHQHSTSVRCDTCKESFTYVCQLNKHQHTFLHFNSTPITCKLCDMEFPNNYCLDSHNFFWHESLYQCQTCGICFQNAKKLACHMYVLHGSPTSTKAVNLLFPQTTTSDVKATPASPVSILSPQNTSQVVTKPQEMNLTTLKPTNILFLPNLPQPTHVKLEPQDPPTSGEENASACWPCEKCKKSYKMVENFIAHWKKKHSSNPMPSWFSKLIFCASPDNEREIFVGDLDAPESPKIVKIKEEPVETITTEPRKVHPTKLHTCQRCGNAYSNLATLKKHMTFDHEYEDLLSEIEEHAENNISCTFCMKKLLNDAHLHAHVIAKHSLQVKYKCSECNLTFETSNVYSRHFRVVHKIEKMFQCNICSSSYTSAYHLSTHMRRCHSQRMVHCPHCRHDHSFSPFLQRHFGKCAPDLAFHMCPLCGAIFEELKVARLHVVERHLKKCKRMLHCDICINSFLTKSNLTTHMKNRHFKKYKINNLCLVD